MQVVREQITRALAMKPSSLDQLKNKLRGLNYSEILRLRQSERMSQDDFQSPPIMLVLSKDSEAASLVSFDLVHVCFCLMFPFEKLRLWQCQCGIESLVFR